MYFSCFICYNNTIGKQKGEDLFMMVQVEMETMELPDALSQVFVELNKNKDQQREIEDILATRHNIPRGTFSELLVDHSKIETFEEDEKGAILSVIYEITKNESIDPVSLFSIKQLGRIKKFKKEEDKELDFPHTFGNFVIRTTENDFNTSLLFKEVGDLWNSNILQWSPDIQRKPKESLSKKGELVRKPRVAKLGVSQITELMLKKRFRSNQITFCILMDGHEDISYDQGDLTVNSGNMYIIDGFHRLNALLNTLEKEPDYEGYIDVAIKYLSYDEARFYLGQLNKMSKFDKTFVKVLMNEEISDKIVNDLKSKSALRGRITDETHVGKKKTYLTNFAILSKGIEDIFNPQNNVDRINISEVLVNFFDYLIDYYPEDFSRDITKLIKARNNSLRNYHNTFVIYLVVAKKLYDKHGKTIPSDEIIRIVESFDFSIDGEYSKVLFGEGTGKVNSDQVKKNIRKYAEDKVDLLLS